MYLTMRERQKMRILMFGRGVIATMYGWALTDAGHEVEYFVRPARLRDYSESIDVEIYDTRRKGSEKQVSETLATKLITTLEADHDFDLIFISVSHHSFAAAAKYLAPKLGKATVLIFNHFWNDPEQAAADFPSDQVVWGFPRAGGGFPEGKLRGLMASTVTFGSFNKELNKREVDIRQLFMQAGFEVSEKPDMRGWLLTNFVINGGMNTEQLLAGSGSKVFKHTKHRKNVTVNTRELFPLLIARGVNLELHKSQLKLAKFPPLVGSILLWLAWKFFKPMRITIESHSNLQDVLTTCEVLLDYAQGQNIATPRLERAVKIGLELSR